MTTKVSIYNLDNSLSSAISAGAAGGGPKITAIDITDSDYTVLDDTAVSLSGGYIKITGSGFASGCQVIINSTIATSVTYISSTEVRVQVPGMSSGTYHVYLTNTDGGVAIRALGLSYSATPTWVTETTLPEQTNGDPISIQLDASGATSYALHSGSSLPSGLSLSSDGLLSGTLSPGVETTYNFTIDAIDAENQDSTRTFSVTITVGDEYFKYVTLLLQGNGTNEANNNTFVDGSTNNFTVYRGGNTTQGTFSPYGSNWSFYSPGSGSTLTATAAGIAVGTGDYTFEGWYYFTTIGSVSVEVLACSRGIGSGFQITRRGSNWTADLNSSAPQISAGVTLVNNTWYHIAVTRQSGTTYLFTNGVLNNSNTNLNSSYTSTTFALGALNANTDYNLIGYISNVRFVSGTALYTSSFTPSTTPLTAISGTQLLIASSNRFIDKSSNAYTITVNGTPTVQRFSPFGPSTAYSAATYGGSGYFDGSGDYLRLSSSAMALTSGDFTVEAWVYLNALPTSDAWPSAWSSTGVLVACGSAGVGDGFNCIIGSTQIFVQNNDTKYGSATHGMTVGQWYHLAYVRSGTTIYFFVNGVQKGTASFSGSIGTGAYTWIGSETGEGAYINGYISNLRIVNGTALYTSGFTPSTEPLTAIANTSLLLNFTNAGIYDGAMMNNFETVGNAQISTSVKKYGTGSLAFDGTGDYLKTPASPNLNLSTGNFTIECWFYYASTPPSGSGYDYLWAIGSNNINGFGLYIQGGVPKIWNSSSVLTTTGSISATTWYHIAVVRSSGTLTVYLNGVSIGSVSLTSDLSGGATSGFNIARWINASDPEEFGGYIDDLRITKDVARYTANFTPPDAEFKCK